MRNRSFKIKFYGQAATSDVIVATRDFTDHGVISPTSEFLVNYCYGKLCGFSLKTRMYNELIKNLLVGLITP